MFRLTQKLSKGLWAFFAVLAVSVSLFSSLIITTQPAHAADKQAVKTPCVGDGVSTGYKSPFSKTSNMCLGDEASTSRRFFQFAIKLEKGADVSVTAKSASGSTISFVKESDTLYVSKPGSNSMGYAGFVLGTNPACSSSDKNNKITITTKGPGSNNTDTKEINLCSYKNSASDSLIYQTASLKGVSSTGTILGNLGVERSDPLVPENKKRATIEKDYVTKFTLEGPTKIDGNNRLPASGNGGFDLSNGRLSIGQLQPGSYNLKIVYNDKAAMSASGGDPGLTKEIAFTFNDINVRAGGTVWIGGSNASLVKYTTTDAADTNQTTEEDSLSTCTVEGVGWIVCPVMTFMGGIVDGAYNFVSGLLVVQPLVTTSSSDDNVANKGIYTAWSVMRNIANVAFVIAFLIIIFSQLTGMGVSNYGVKKLLPRLVVAAVLVNLSFWVSAIAVDLSNIAGSSTVQIFDSINQEIVKTIAQSDPNYVNYSGDLLNRQSYDDGVYANGGQWTDLIGFVLAGGAVAGAVYYVGLSALIPAVLAAVFAIVTVFLVLTLRQALIILLIVVSPLAFVAYLLPNTEDLFTRWRKLFMTLLLMYPIIAGIFGASALASTVIMQGAKDNVVVQIMGACIAILPLAITPIVMKSAGGLLNRFGGIVNNREKGPLDRLRKSGEGYRKQRQDLRNSRALGGAGQAGRGAFVRWRARRESIGSNLSNEANRSKTEYVAGQFENNARFRNTAAGASLGIEAPQSATQRALANAINIQTKLEADEVNAAKAVIEHANLSGSQRQELATTGSVSVSNPDASGKMVQTTYSSPIMQKAAIQEQMRTGSLGQIHEIVATSGSEKMSAFKQTISQGVVSNGITGKNPALGGKTLDDIAQGRIKSQADLDVRVLASIKEGKFNAENVAGMHDDAREMAIKVARSTGDVVAIDALKSAANEIGSSPELSVKIAGNARAGKQISDIKAL
jgi:hypothetical protein